MANLINKDVQWTDPGSKRVKRGFVTRMIGRQYEIIGEDDNKHMVDMPLCADIDDLESLTENKDA